MLYYGIQAQRVVYMHIPSMECLRLHPATCRQATAVLSGLSWVMECETVETGKSHDLVKLQTFLSGKTSMECCNMLQ